MTQHSPQQQTQAHTQSQLEHALQQHAQAHGLSLSGIDWGAVTSAILTLIQVLSRAGGGGTATP